MKRVLGGGTVVYLDTTKDEDFGDIRVDMAGGELHILLKAFFDSLSPKLQEKHAVAYKALSAEITRQGDKFEVDIQPVMNMKTLRKRNSLFLGSAEGTEGGSK